MEIVDKIQCFGGVLHICVHQSEVLGCHMKFSLFLPPKAAEDKVYLLTFLSGLTCTHENFTTKAGAYGHAARYGLAILAPDTSPRGEAVPNHEDYDLGQGAGFYINATQAPWNKHYHMEDYIVKELNPLVLNNFPLIKDKQAISGHSMGGHGALTLYLKYPDLYHSASAFAPIVSPSQVPWGQKAFSAYLGDEPMEWLEHDACALMKMSNERSQFHEILIDQGGDDSFLERELCPHLFRNACALMQQKLNLRMQAGYDHSYYFIQSFMEDHIRHHAANLQI